MERRFHGRGAGHNGMCHGGKHAERCAAPQVDSDRSMRHPLPSKSMLLTILVSTQQLFATMHGTFCFMAWHGYGWYLSATATFLYLSWLVHNFVAWLKIKPFFLDARSMFTHKVGRWVARIYLITLAMTVGPICLQIVDNYLYFNNINNRYYHVRPYETLMR